MVLPVPPSNEDINTGGKQGSGIQRSTRTKTPEPHEQSPPPELPLPTGSPVRAFFTATKSFEPMSANQLGLKPGDRLYVHSAPVEGWFAGIKVSDGSEGLFPRSCVEEAQVGAGAASKISVMPPR